MNRRAILVCAHRFVQPELQDIEETETLRFQGSNRWQSRAKRVEVHHVPQRAEECSKREELS